MAHFNVRSSVQLRSLLLFAVSIALPALGRADDFSFGGDSGCDDPSITSNIFTLPPTNSSGGLCLAFGNHSGAPLTSVQFTTTIPDANSDPMLCSGGDFFTTCDYIVDTLDNTITVEFFGLDADHQGIPVVPFGIDRSPDNFTINLNNPVCDATGLCTQPGGSDGLGDWLSGGAPETFTGFANGAAPEPTTWALLLGGLGLLMAGGGMTSKSRVR